MTTLHKLADLLHFAIATNPVHRGNQILLTSQSPGETNQSFCLYTNTRICCLRNNSKLFTKRVNIFMFLYLVGFFLCVLCQFFCITNFTITIFLSLFLPPSLSLPSLCYNPFFSLATTLSAPSHLLSPPVFTSLFYLSPTCHHTNPPSYTLTTC
jgi:hypothetical protein